MQPMNSKGGCKEWYFKVLWKKIHSTQYIVVAEYSWIWSNLVLRVARLDLELVVTICLPVCCSFSKPTEAFCSFCWSRVLHFFCWEFFPFLIFFFFFLEHQWLEMDQVGWKDTFGEMTHSAGLCNKFANWNKNSSVSVIDNVVSVRKQYITY